jgi:voltage-gated potassium channel
MNPIVRLFRLRIYLALFLLFSLLCVGVVGFMMISDYSLIDAIYMTVITVTTVGFGEVVPLNDQAKIFTIFLILTSIIIVGYALSIITEYILSRSDVEELKHKRMQKAIDNLTNHIIICGYGRNGKQAAIKLKAYNKPFVVIERDREVEDRLKSADILYIIGNANEDEVLVQAGVHNASSFITALPNDADNLFIVLSARQINKNINIISRASQETSYKKLKFAGANNVILPDKIGGDHMASLVVIPGLMEFIDNLSIVGKSNINIEEIPIEKLYKSKEVKTSCSIIGYKDEKGEYVVNPEAELELQPNSKIIVLGRPEQIETLNEIYNIT